jgi:PII-like signaling protein
LVVFGAVVMMKLKSSFADTTLLRIFVGDDDTYEDQPLYEAILGAARDAHLAGVTISRGIAGYGRSAHLHEVFRGFSDDLPIVIEIIDSEEKINSWLPLVESLLRGGLVTMENVRVLQGGAVPPARPDKPITRMA